jgi:hypothetical protein
MNRPCEQIQRERHTDIDSGQFIAIGLRHLGVGMVSGS